MAGDWLCSIQLQWHETGPKRAMWERVGYVEEVQWVQLISKTDMENLSNKITLIFGLIIWKRKQTPMLIGYTKVPFSHSLNVISNTWNTDYTIRFPFIRFCEPSPNTQNYSKTINPPFVSHFIGSFVFVPFSVVWFIFIYIQRSNILL